MAASTARIPNAGGPAVLQVLVQDVGGVGEEVRPHVGGGRPGQLAAGTRSARRAVLRQVKYVYDWWKPILARARIMAGRVNASARKITSGSVRATSASSRSQNGSGLVCGLSTRKIRTPWAIQ